jgi:hypothetical protein
LRPDQAKKISKTPSQGARCGSGDGVGMGRQGHWAWHMPVTLKGWPGQKKKKKIHFFLVKAVENSMSFY